MSSGEDAMWYFTMDFIVRKMITSDFISNVIIDCNVFAKNANVFLFNSCYKIANVVFMLTTMIYYIDI